MTAPRPLALTLAAHAHDSMKEEVRALEEMIEAIGDQQLSGRQLKRLDKAITVIKVGLKIIKKSVSRVRVTAIKTKERRR